jgi:hypothetical protein
MARLGSYEEQWEPLPVGRPRFRVRLRPIPPGTWRLRPRNYVFEPFLVFWGMVGFPDAQQTDGVSYRTLWFAFREPPHEHLERNCHDAEAIVVGENDDPVHRLLVPGYCFRPTVDGLHPVADAEVLEASSR